MPIAFCDSPNGLMEKSCQPNIYKWSFGWWIEMRLIENCKSSPHKETLKSILD